MRTRYIAGAAWIMTVVLAAAHCPAVGPAAGKAGADWRNWRGPNHDGISTAKNWSSSWPKEGPRVLWRASVGLGAGSVTISSGRLYTMGNIKGTAGYATPVPFVSRGDGGSGGGVSVAIFSAHGLAVVRASDGKELWKMPWPTNSGINVADPIVSGGRIFISSDYGVGCALVTGGAGCTPSTVWRSRKMKNHWSTSVLWKGHLYGFDTARLRCLDVDTGKPRWSKKGLGKGTLMLADGKLIIMSHDGELVIAEATPAAFKPLARARILNGKCWAVPVLAGGRIHCRTDTGDLACVDVRKK